MASGIRPLAQGDLLAEHFPHSEIAPRSLSGRTWLLTVLRGEEFIDAQRELVTVHAIAIPWITCCSHPLVYVPTTTLISLLTLALQ